jgi:hypothetical protein
MPSMVLAKPTPPDNITLEIGPDGKLRWKGDTTHFLWLILSGQARLIAYGSRFGNEMAVETVSHTLTDQAITAAHVGKSQGRYGVYTCWGRGSHQPGEPDHVNTSYQVAIDPPAATADFYLNRRDGGSGDTFTRLATEAVDLGQGATMLSCSGSTIKGFRASVADPFPATPQIFAVDTAYTSGCYGYPLYFPGDMFPPSYGYAYTRPADGHWGLSGMHVRNRLLPPQSPVPTPLFILETDVIFDPERKGVGKPGDVSIYYNLPLDAKVTYGTLDYPERDPATFTPKTYTAHLMIFGPPDEAAKVLEWARANNKFVIKPPYDPIEVTNILKRRDPLKKVRVNEVKYATLGAEELEVDSITDFYEREVLDLGRINPANMPEFDATIDMWIERARRFGRPDTERGLKKAKRK